MEIENVFATRLVSARKMVGLSLQELADKLGNVVTKQALSKYEQGKMKPDSQVLIALSNALSLSIDYFYSTPKVKVEFEEIDFRKFVTKLSKPDEVTAIERSKDSFERYFELEETLQLNEESDYFDFDKKIASPGDAEEAAKQLRKQWDLGYDPIPDVVEMLEDKGYKVIDIDAPEGFDGMKAKVGNRKVIVLSRTKNEQDDIVRKRLTALHELAHHALKFAEDITQKQLEKLCNVFAAAVLYPEDMARKELHKERFHFFEKELIMIKERWGISFTAIFYRANHLGILNDFVLKKFTIGFNKRGYNIPNKEPGRFRSREKPTRMERLVFLGLGKDVLTINEAAFFAGITAWELRKQMQVMV
jgi:Zn-dependent peptidase ImmA (M78 family)/DNA-binding XRE family transcriptional regulator